MTLCLNQKLQSRRKRCYTVLVTLLLLVAAVEQTVELVVPLQSLQPVEYYISNLLLTEGEPEEEAMASPPTLTPIQNVFVPFQKWKEQKFQEIVSRLEHADEHFVLEKETKLSPSEIELLVSLQKSMEQKLQDIEARARRDEAEGVLEIDARFRTTKHTLFVPLQQWKEQKLRDIEAVVKHEKGAKFLDDSASRM